MASSSFFSSISEEHSSKPRKKPEPIIEDYSDERLIAEKIVKAEDLQSINMSHIDKNFSLDEIIQGAIGNCYFLGVLSNIIEFEPDILKGVITYKNNKFYVTLFDAKNPEQAYVYILDPTKVLGGNNHKHDLLFILEKAYALHRIRLEKTPLTLEELIIKDIYHQSDKDFRLTAQTYELRQEAKKAEIRAQIEKEMMQLQQKSVAAPHPETLISDPKEAQLLTILDEHNGSIPEALDAYMMTQLPTKEDNRFRVKVAINKFQNERIDYVSGLKGGTAEDAFKALVGNDILVESFQNPHQYTITNILMELLPEISTSDPHDLGRNVTAFLQAIFQRDHLAQDYFVCSIKNTDSALFFEIAMNYQADKNKSMSHQAFLKKFFRDHIDWLADTSGRYNAVQKLIEKFIVSNISFKRGLGLYTDTQQEIFDRIQTALSQGKMITCITHKNLSLNPDQKRKGLVENHLYFIADAFERGSLKFLQLRNPWGDTVLEYTFKKKILDGVETQILSSEEKKQLSPLLQVRALNLMGRTSPRLLAKKNSAKAINSSSTQGIFEIEMTHFVKDFYGYAIAARPKNTRNQRNIPTK